MGPEGAVDIVYKRELDGAENREAARQKKIEEFRDRFASPYVAADRGFVDAIIQPSARRPQACDRNLCRPAVRVRAEGKRGAALHAEKSLKGVIDVAGGSFATVKNR